MAPLSFHSERDLHVWYLKRVHSNPPLCTLGNVWSHHSRLKELVAQGYQASTLSLSLSLSLSLEYVKTSESPFDPPERLSFQHITINRVSLLQIDVSHRPAYTYSIRSYAFKSSRYRRSRSNLNIFPCDICRVESNAESIAWEERFGRFNINEKIVLNNEKIGVAYFVRLRHTMTYAALLFFIEKKRLFWSGTYSYVSRSRVRQPTSSNEILCDFYCRLMLRYTYPCVSYLCVSRRSGSLPGIISISTIIHRLRTNRQLALLSDHRSSIATDMRVDSFVDEHGRNRAAFRLLSSSLSFSVFFSLFIALFLSSRKLLSH